METRTCWTWRSHLDCMELQEEEEEEEEKPNC